MESYCVRGYADALEVVPYTLAENAGLNPIQIVTELRSLHAAGNKYHGINVKKVRVGGSRMGEAMRASSLRSPCLPAALHCGQLPLPGARACMHACTCLCLAPPLPAPSHGLPHVPSRLLPPGGCRAPSPT